MSLISDIFCRIAQKKMFKLLHEGREVNSFSTLKESGKKIRDDGVVYVNDIQYGTAYPNSYLDIWYPNEDTSAKRPTIVYFHGGGFLFGDKVMGDPLGVGKSDEMKILNGLLKHDYNIVSANYAFAPKYRFPVQIIQMNEVLEFLLKSQKEYSLDMNNVILMGGSAGACISAIYGGILTNSEYAKILDIKPVISRNQVQAIVIDEAALNVNKMSSNLEKLFFTWIGGRNPKKSLKGKQINVASWITENYIPSYVIASNYEEDFSLYGEELDTVLIEKGITHKYYYRDPSYDKLKHGFMARYEDNQYARECFDGMLEFLKTAKQSRKI